METAATPLLHSPEDTGHLLGGIGRSSVYELMQRGELRSVKIGRRRFIPASEIERFVEALVAGTA